MTRSADYARETGETRIEVNLTLDGSGKTSIDTGLRFLDHMLDALGRHGGFDLAIDARGDIDVDDHHTVEDCAIALGRALGEALGDRSGIRRFGSAYVPLDESLARAVVDLSGRPWPDIDLVPSREKIGDTSTENLTHFFRSLALEGGLALHVDVLKGDNDHHKAEAAFKAVALALRDAVALRGSEVPSTKGVLG